MAIVARRGLGRKAATRKYHSRTPADPAIDRSQAPADRRAAQRREPGHPNREGGRGESSRPPASGGGFRSDPAQSPDPVAPRPFGHPARGPESGLSGSRDGQTPGRGSDGNEARS